jgi:putative tricarboxylic transport membrane protein
MEISNLLHALQYVCEPLCLLFIVCGTAFGLVGGAMPGISSSMAVVLLMPFTYSMEPVQAIVMMVAVYVGGSTGGAISSILLKTPGTPEAVPTTFDGYPLAQRGETGKALGLAVTASSFGSIFSALIMVIASPLFANIALKFQSAEYFALAVLGLSCVTSIGAKNQARALVSALLGLLISTVGIDPINGVQRYTFGKSFLSGGIEMIPVIIGCFALAEVYHNLEIYYRYDSTVRAERISMELLKFKEMFKMWWTFIRSSIIGTLVGILPAAGGTIASLLSYSVAVKSDKAPDRFGKGAYEGVIASEAANNGAVGGSMVPTLVLGIPGSSTSAIIMMIFILQGLRPGPLLMKEQPTMLYALFIGIIAAALLLFVLGKYIAREFARILKLPYPMLAAIIIVMGAVGAYSLKGSYYDIVWMFIFGLVGYLFNKFDFSIPAFVLAFILGGMAENAFRQQLIINNGNYGGFFLRPISCVVLIASIIIFFSPFFAKLFKIFAKKEEPVV